MRLFRRTAAAVVLLALGACGPDTRALPPRPAASPSISQVASPTASPSLPPARFEAGRVFADDRVLSVSIGTREDVSRGYARAAAFVAARFAALGYRVVRQQVAIPAGKSEGVPVPAGTADNVLAYPPDYDPAAPHLLVGAHLDTVAVSPGANDNGSGAAMVLELARLSRLRPGRLPVVLAEWAGEERRLKGPQGAMFGSRTYLASLTARERASLVAVLNLDMVGNGAVVLVCHGGTTKRQFLEAAISTGRRLRIRVREQVITQFFSDHLPFERAGIPVAWLWTGDTSTVHTARDTMAGVRMADLERVGRLSWELIRSYRG